MTRDVNAVETLGQTAAGHHIHAVTEGDGWTSIWLDTGVAACDGISIAVGPSSDEAITTAMCALEGALSVLGSSDACARLIERRRQDWRDQHVEPPR